MIATYTYKGVKRAVSEWARIKGISHPALLFRIEKGVPEECIFAPIQMNIDIENQWSSNDWEAWGGLNRKQLETMREFDQIGKISKC